MAKNQYLLTAYTDNLKDNELARYLVEVVTWPVNPSQAETVARRERALDLLIKVQGEDLPAWGDPARAFLHEMAKNYPELAQPWLED